MLTDHIFPDVCLGVGGLFLLACELFCIVAIRQGQLYRGFQRVRRLVLARLQEDLV
jgi:hypothetical protein